MYFPSVDIAEAAPTEDVRTLASEQGTETILLVEDEQRVRDLLSTVLRRCGYTVLEACRGEEALEVAARITELRPAHASCSCRATPTMSVFEPE